MNFTKIKQILSLSLVLAKVGLKSKNEGSHLGFLWYLLNPVLTFSLLFLIFNDRLGVGIARYPLYLLLGIIMFNFFQNTTTEAIRSITTDNRHLIKSINFPREALVLGILQKNLFSHIFDLILFFLLLVYFGVSPVMLMYYPFILVLFSLFIFGASLMLSVLAVYFIDLENIWSFFVRILWFITPIFYSIGGQTRLYYINLFNPVYYFVSVAREIIIYNKLPQYYLSFGVVVFSLIFLVTGLLVFNRFKIKLAEMI